MHADFRHVLRQATRDDHDCVDAVLSGVDIRCADGFRRFLLIHREGFGTMLALADPRGEASWRLRTLTARIDADLRSLGVGPEVAGHAGDAQGTVDALALDYMIEGSRLGSQVLARHWAGARDPLVKRADAYFSLPPAPERWRAVCAALSAIDADSPRAAAIVADTGRLFGIFRDAADRATGQGFQKAAVS